MNSGDFNLPDDIPGRYKTGRSNMELKEIENFYIKYGPMILRRCRFLLKSEERARDAMQEVFVAVLTRKEQLSGIYPSSLFYKIATNICLNIIKKEQKEKNVDKNPDLLTLIAATDSFVEKTMASDILERIFKTEPASTRTMAVMHYIDGLTLEETARECGFSVSGVRKRLRKLKEKAQKLQAAGEALS